MIIYTSKSVFFFVFCFLNIIFIERASLIKYMYVVFVIIQKSGEIIDINNIYEYMKILLSSI